MDSADRRIGAFDSRHGGAAGAGGGGGGLGVGAAAGGAAALASAGIGAVAALASRAGSAIVGAIGNAATLNETLSKTAIIFGPGAQVIISQADEMAKMFGTSKNEFINAATSFGAVFKGIGKGQQEAAQLGIELATLGMDMASFDNAANSEVFTALQASLRGEFDPLERFRVFLSAAKVEAKALEMGLASSKAGLDDNAKKTATLALIYEQTKDAQGDLGRTAGGAANQFRQAGGGIENFATSLGQLLLPAVTVGTAAFNEFLASTIQAFESSRPMFEGWAAALTGAVDSVSFVVRNWPDIWELAKIGIAEKFINLGEYLLVLPVNLGLIADYIAGNWSKLIIDGVNAVGSVFQNLGTNLGNLWFAVSEFLAGRGFTFDWTPLLSGFEATAAKLPELIQPTLTTLSDERETVMARIAGREAKRAEDLKAGTGPVEKAAEEAKEKAEKGEKYHATAAVEVGTKEFSSAIARHRNAAEGGDDKPIKNVDRTTKDHLTETRAMHLTLKQVLEKTGTTLSSYSL